ncbi:MAG: hypothetical protein ABI970_25405, partial [Chloroflexota bacterium]
MSEKQTVPNYPDILGYITDGQQLTIGVVQMALGVRPPVARVGRPFAVILLLQNMSDANVEVSATLHLPLKDAAGEKLRFGSPNEHSSVSLLPAEVGYLVIPVGTRANAAPAKEYLIGVEVQVESASKPRFIRQIEQSEEINLDYYFSLSEESIQKLMVLKMLNFSTKWRTKFSNLIEASFALAPAKDMPRNDVKAGWFSLWTLGSDSDARPLLERYRGTLALSIIPGLTPATLYKALFPVTKERFSKAYNIQAIEIHFITKLMVYILSIAPHPPLVYHYPEEAMYTVMTLLKNGWPTDGTPIPLPYWCRGLLHMLGMDEEVLKDPSLAFTGALYDELMRDAITHGFHIMSVATRREMAGEHELKVYTDYLVQTIRRPKRPLTFTDIYLPLVLAGTVVAEDVPVPNEKPLDRVHDLIKLYNKRA